MIPHEARAAGGAEFALVVGRLIQIFGNVEWQTYEWIRVLRRDQAIWKKYRGQTLAQRIVAIKALLDAARVPDELRAVAHAAWDAVGPLAGVRNMVTHGPFAGVDLPEHGEQMGILNLRPADPSKDYELLPLSTIQSASDGAAEVVIRLQGALMAVRSRLANA